MKKSFIMPSVIISILLLFVLSFSGTYNGLVSLDEKVNESWAQLENVYQRRLDLIPNLVETVKGYAKHEQETLTLVTEARAKAINSTNPSINKNPNNFEGFQNSQNELSGALSKLLVVVEKYPDLKANQNFLELQSQLEGTENRIAVERGRYNEAAKELNTRLRVFPGNIIAGMFGFSKREYFKAESGANVAPSVMF